MLRLDLCDYGDTYIFVKRTIDLGLLGMMVWHKKVLYLKIMSYLGHTFQKPITHSQKMQKILIFECQGNTCWSITTITFWHKEVSGIIIEMEWIKLIIIL